jgi:uncharacterized membrane protein
MKIHGWMERVEAMLGLGSDQASERKRQVLRHVSDRTVISRDLTRERSGQDSLGHWLADRVAAFGGSWTFISVFVLILIAWTLTNTYVLVTGAFDPYPFIFLNLLLSMMAALQAPIIMMSQNRQSAKDRAAAQHAFEVNLKAELEIMALHEKVDHLQSQLLLRLLEKQEELQKMVIDIKNGTGK